MVIHHSTSHGITWDDFFFKETGKTWTSGRCRWFYKCNLSLLLRASAPAAINNPVTGLVGSVSIAGLGISAFRSVSLDIQNGHELAAYYFGTDGLSGPLFVPGSRMTGTLTVSANVNSEVVKFFNRIQDFEAQDFSMVLGSATGRRLEVTCPKVKFATPTFAMPDTGSVPIDFEGPCYQTDLDQADEVQIEFK